MTVYQYADGQNVDEMVHNMLERTAGLLSESGFGSHVAIRFDIDAAELSVLFKNSEDIELLLKVSGLPARSSISHQARELYETWSLPRKNVINFQDDEIDQFLSSLGMFTEQCGYS